MSAIPEGSSLADLLDSRRLFQFVVAAEAPTLAAAAADLFITQQALSSAIRQLERDLGVELFSRAQRSLQLTDAGHELYTGAKPLLAGIRMLANATRNISNPQRAFVIGHSPAISGEEVYRIIEPIVVADPTASITVRQVFPSTMRDGLLDGSLDLALRRGVDMPADLATDTLLSSRCVSPSCNPTRSLRRIVSISARSPRTRSWCGLRRDIRSIQTCWFHIVAEAVSNHGC
ncbi:Putative transcriptional regulator%2C LysR family [Mycobacteroides abscessus]|nr:Putative transcriptional regulator%2C LysR family [Mycobacteroides abscessus]